MAPPLTLQTLPRAILHIDGDAFFASCEQSRRPLLQERPVVTGKERGIAASMSYEAKARGVRLADIRKICPEAVILPSDYETYSLLSTRFFAIVRRYTPEVEEYSVDECFADVTGLRRPLRMSYIQIAERIKQDLDTELGFTFSVGLAPNKVVAKIASKWQKPSGLTAIPGLELHRYLAQLPVENVWGIGHQTTALLHKHGVQTALQFARWYNASPAFVAVGRCSISAITWSIDDTCAKLIASTVSTTFWISSAETGPKPRSGKSRVAVPSLRKMTL